MARLHSLPAARVLGVENAQRSQVLDAPVQCCGQVPSAVRACGALRSHSRSLPRNGMLDGLAARVAQRHRDPIGDRHRFYGRGPLAAGGDRYLPPQDAIRGRGTAVAADEQLMLALTPPAGEPQRGVLWRWCWRLPAAAPVRP